MADRTLTERLQPSLLDRLTDEAPGEATERREDRVIDVRRLRDIVRRDLSWLLNTSNHEALLDPEAVPGVCRSVINYGVREVAGELSGLQRAQEIREAIRTAIERFEPRIRAGSLDVVLREDKGTGRSIISFDIRAEMWAQPTPLELYLRSEVNVATGELKLARTA
jgi:type VI secretion system protein ImpF